MTLPEDKFNTIMPESDERTLCIRVEKPISKEGYTLNFLPRLNKMIDRTGEIRILVYFQSYHGWEPEAALEDMDATLQFGDKLAKLALVNPPEREVLQRLIKKPLLRGDVRFFDEDELDDALGWVKA